MSRSWIGQDTDVPCSIVQDMLLIEISATGEVIAPQGSSLKPSRCQAHGFNSTSGQES